MRVTQEYNFGEKGLAWISEGKLGQLGASSARLKSKKPNDKLVLRYKHIGAINVTQDTNTLGP